MLCDDGEGWGGRGREVHEGGDLCTQTADSFSCNAETKHNVVKQVYSNLTKRTQNPGVVRPKYGVKGLAGLPISILPHIIDIYNEESHMYTQSHVRKSQAPAV